MVVEFLARYDADTGPKTKRQFEKEAEERRIKYLTGKTDDIDAEVFKKPKYEYLPIVIDVKTDVRLFNYYDEGHTTVSLYGGQSYVLAIHFNNFKVIYQIAKGNMRVAHFSEFAAPEEVVKEKSPKLITDKK